MTAPQAALAKAVGLVAAARQAGVKIVFVRLLSHPGGESKIAQELLFYTNRIKLMLLNQLGVATLRYLRNANPPSFARANQF